MKKILSLVVALGVVALFSSVTLAGAECSYHKTQAAVPTTDTSKEVATVPATEKIVADQMKTAEVTPPAKPAEPKK